MKSELNNSKQQRLGVINDYQFGLFEIINLVCLCNVISAFGIAANVINIIIFFKQGFTLTINISLFGLAISDLFCLITLTWVGVWVNPFMSNSDVPVSSDFYYLTGACLHALCGRITSYITIYVTAERCLCILVPLKIKQIITPLRTGVVVCSIYVVNILNVVPEYATSYLDWQFSPERNKSIIAIVYGSGREYAVAFVYFTYCLTGFLSFVALVAFTVTLAVKLQQSSKWRKEATAGSDQHESVSNKEKKTVKMVIIIATILIVCYIPGTAVSLTTFVEPEFYLQGRYYRLYLSMWSVVCIFNSINASVNIFLYYKMSSNYRKVFLMLMGRK